MESTVTLSHLMLCINSTLTHVTVACTNIAVSSTPLLVVFRAGYPPGLSRKSLKEASTSLSLERYHAKEKHITKVNMNL